MPNGTILPGHRRRLIINYLANKRMLSVKFQDVNELIEIYFDDLNDQFLQKIVSCHSLLADHFFV